MSQHRGLWLRSRMNPPRMLLFKSWLKEHKVQMTEMFLILLETTILLKMRKPQTIQAADIIIKLLPLTEDHQIKPKKANTKKKYIVEIIVTFS